MKTYEQIASYVNNLIESNYINIAKHINELATQFAFKGNKLTYTEKTQSKINRILTTIAEKTGTFDKKSWQEQDCIMNELTIIDTITGDKMPLIDIDKMNKRVKKVLSSNNVYSCLKSLALSNNCAHIFDNIIAKKRTAFIKYYDLLYPGEIDSLYPTIDDKEELLSFFNGINNAFPKISNTPFYNLKSITDHQFKGMHEILFKKTKIKTQMKIQILKQLNISFNFKDLDEINHKFQKVVDNKDEVIKSYLFFKYKEGMKYVSLQNRMFAIKDYFISMIGQMLIDGDFKNIFYELVKTPNAKKGFNYMLIINDDDLSYYIEVHMPDYISKELINKYGLKERNYRTTIGVPTKAVYYREKDEIKKVYRALKNKSISKGINRAKVITRGYSEDDGVLVFASQESNRGQLLPMPTVMEHYSFTTDLIKDKEPIFERFLKKRRIHLDELKRIISYKSNENYDQRIITSNINRVYMSLYKSLTDDEKIDFINYTIYDDSEKDFWDDLIYKYIQNNKQIIGINTSAKLIMNKEYFKDKFLIDNYKKIKKLVNINDRDLKIFLKNMMYSYINEYLGYNKEKIIKTEDFDGPKKTR